MNKIENKLIYLLSDPSLRDEDINKLYFKLTNGGLEECFFKVRKIRKIFSESKSKKIDQIDSDISAYDRKILNEVEELLRKESNLSVKQSIDALCDELQINIPSSRRSFKDQILYLSNKIEGSEILNAAYRIRNHLKHNSSKSAWPLKDNL